MAPIVLYYDPISGPSRAVLLTIRNLGLDVEIKKINLMKKEQFKPDYIKMNPQHCVPTLDDNGFILWESNAIIAYLVDSVGKDSLYPKNLQQRAIVNQRMSFVSETLRVVIVDVCAPLLKGTDNKFIVEKKQTMYDKFQLLDTFLKGQKYFAGNQLTVSDLKLLAIISNAIYSGADISSFSNIVDWYGLMKDVPGFEENNTSAKLYGDLVKANLKDDSLVL